VSHRERNTSDCGELDDADELSRVHENRPGLPVISYRLGRHGDFLARMLQRLPNERNGGDAGSVPPLGRLTYRGQDDPTVALLDACASLLDVLAFYQERIANESFIRTAIERRSVLELARSIGYEMRPGVAASTLLAFTVDDAPGSPELVAVPVGTQVLSIPKKDELPQTFETVEPVEARVEWNQVGVQVQPITLGQTIDTKTTEIFLTRRGPRLARGDTLLLMDEADSTQRLLRRVHRVTDFPDRDYRKVELQPIGEVTPIPLEQPRVFTFGLRTRFFGHNAPRPDGRTIQLERVFVSTIQTPVRCVALASAATGLGASGYQAAPPDPASAVTALVVDYHESIVAGGTGGFGLPHEVLEQIREAGRSVQYALDESNEKLRRTIRIWNLELDREELALPIESTIAALAFSRDDLYLAAATHEEGEVRLHVWNVGTGALITSARLGPDMPIERTSPVRSILFLDSGEAGRYQITTIHTVPAAVFWDFHPGPEPVLQSSGRVDLSGLGDLAGNPLQVIDGDRSLTGDAAGVTTYREKRTLDVVPDDVVLTDGRFDLDKIHRNVIPGGWVLLVDAEGPGLPGGDSSTKYEAYRISDVTTRHRSDFGIAKRVTRLHVDLAEDAESPPAFSLRGTEIHAQSDELTLATLQVALPEPIEGDRIPLAAAVPDLTGRTVIVRGRPILQPEEEEEEEPQVPASFPITAILPGGQTIALTAQSLDATGNPELLIDENGFTARFGENARDLVQWNESVDFIHEVARVASTTNDPPMLTLVEPLQNVYDWRSVQIFANVAPATHGETITEVLGSGDGLIRNQRFKLGKPPLTFVPAPGVTGRQSTLQVRVNGVLWQERDSLLQVAPADEVFTVRIQNDGKTDITFGDGVRGARLPSGAENVVATYRSGLGADGEVEAGQLALLQTKPLGIREVNNPLPASGAEPPETEAETRENAPRTVLVLGRVVSIQDYEDFSKTFPGVGKAKAIPMWDGFSRFVHLTIGTEGGESIVRGTPLYQSLLGALDNVRDTHQLVTIEGYDEIYFGVHGRVLVDPRYESEPVLAAVKIALQRAFSYDAREFGQDVTAAEIVAIIHGVAGVMAVDIDALHCTRRPECPCDDPMHPVDGTKPPPQLLEARLARLEGGAVKRAELLLIDSTHIYLEPMT
jgi:hypothetical protein